MPLSEHEQRLLEQIERSLYQEDPKFASTVRSTNPRTFLLRRVRRGALVFLLGLIVLVVGVSLNRQPVTVILGVVGFLLMLVSALRGAADLKRIGGRGEPISSVRSGRGGRGGKAARTPFMERIEERWRRRWEQS